MKLEPWPSPPCRRRLNGGWHGQFSERAGSTDTFPQTALPSRNPPPGKVSVLRSNERTFAPPPILLLQRIPNPLRPHCKAASGSTTARPGPGINGKGPKLTGRFMTNCGNFPTFPIRVIDIIVMMWYTHSHYAGHRWRPGGGPIENTSPRQNRLDIVGPPDSPCILDTSHRANSPRRQRCVSTTSSADWSRWPPV